MLDDLVGDIVRVNITQLIKKTKISHAWVADHLFLAAVSVDGVDDVFLRLEAEKLDKFLQLSEAVVFTVGDLQETDLISGDYVDTDQIGLWSDDEKYYQDLWVRISPLHLE